MGLFDFILSEDTNKRFKEAKDLNEQADSMVEEARDEFETAQESCKKAIKKLDMSKQKVYKGTMALFALSIKKIHSSNFTMPSELQEITKYSDGTDFFYPYVDTNTSMWESSLGRDVAAIVSGFTFGTIGGLVWRSYMKKKSKIALDNAYAAYAQAEVVEEQLRLATEVCGYIEERAVLFNNILTKLNKLFLPLVCSLEAIIDQKGTNYKIYDVHEKKKIAAAVSTALSIKSILDVGIINKDGSLSLESRKLAIDLSSQLQLECDSSALGKNEALPIEDEFSFSSGTGNKLIYCDTYDTVVKIVAKVCAVDRRRINMYSVLDDMNVSDSNIHNIKCSLEQKLQIYIPDGTIQRKSSIEQITDYAVGCLDETFKDIKFLYGQVIQSETTKKLIDGAKSFLDLMKNS